MNKTILFRCGLVFLLAVAGFLPDQLITRYPRDPWPPPFSLTTPLWRALCLGTPKGSHAVQTMDWLNSQESGFPIPPRTTIFIFHADGDDTNVLTKDFVRQSFAPLDAFRAVDDFPTICAKFPDQICDVIGILQLWNSSLAVFDASVTTDQDVLDALAQDVYPDGTPVSLDSIVGNIKYDGDTIVGAQSFTVIIETPEDGLDSTVSEDFEKKALDAIFAVQKELEKDSNFRVETMADRSFGDEFSRAIVNDIPLVPVVFIIMGVFTSSIFFKKDRIRSRSTLGFMAVVSILLSILAGYGLMFVCGVPFSKFSSFGCVVGCSVLCCDACATSIFITNSTSKTQHQ
jgi:Patched family